jgi:PAS domain S-box-containing protein
MKPFDELLAVCPNFFVEVIESLPDGLIITDRESVIAYVNDQTCALTGYSRGELLGRRSYEVLLPPAQWPQMQARLQQRLAGAAEEYELEIQRKEGARVWVAIKGVPFVDEEGQIQGTIGSLRDISARRQLEGENEYLRREFGGDLGSDQLLGQSPGILKVLEQVATVGPTDVAVLITGESGTGKELVAKALHRHSLRNQRPLIRVNCAAVPKDLFESEFFGHLRGAFTGAVRDRMGRFELADEGTLFLDEVGEIPLELQSKLLRVLQEGQFEPVGSDHTRSVDVRLIAATNRPLAEEMARGRFREDLYYRLGVFPIDVPPLRQRRGDVPLLARHFARATACRLGLPEPVLGEADLEALRQYDWPGNVRELQHVIERALIIARGGPLRFELPGRPESPPPSPSPEPGGGLAPPATLGDLERLEKEILARHLEQKNWRIYGPGGAAESLGLKPTTLVSKMKRFGLKKPWGRA